MFGVQAWVGPQSTLRRYWGHMLKIHGTAPHSRHTSPSSLRRGRGVLSLRARTVEKAPLPSTKVGSASGAGSTRPEGYAPWLGHVASPACPRTRAQPSLARCTRESALSSQEVCGSARLGGGGPGVTAFSLNGTSLRRNIASEQPLLTRVTQSREKNI